MFNWIRSWKFRTLHKRTQFSDILFSNVDNYFSTGTNVWIYCFHLFAVTWSRSYRSSESQRQSSSFSGNAVDLLNYQRKSYSFFKKAKSFPCPNCPAGFSEKGSLTRHLRYECCQEPRFACPYCQYRTKWTSSIYNHVRTRHEGLKVYCVDVHENQTVTVSQRRGSTIESPQVIRLQ